MPVLATNVDTYLCMYDDFSRYANNSTMDGQAPIAGANWHTAGETPSYYPTVLNGCLVSQQSNKLGYLYSIQSSPVSELGCDVVWAGGNDMTQLPMTLTISPDTTTLTLTKMLHFNFGPSGFSLMLGDAVGPGKPLLPVTAGIWTVPMNNDGNTSYRVKMAVRGNGVVIFGPNGEVFGWSDARVSQFTGGLCFLEPSIQPDGLKAMVKRTWAATNNNPMNGLSVNPPSPFATNDDFAALGSYFYYGRVAGALNRMGEVDIGFIGSTLSFPQIQFGPQNIITSIDAAASIGTTSLSTVDYIPQGTLITLDPGINQESMLTGPVSGTGPYTVMVQGLAKAHAKGAIVQCTAPETMRYTVQYNQIAGTLQFPLNGTQAVQIGPFIFGTEAVPGEDPIGRLVLDNSATPGVITSHMGGVRLNQSNTFRTGWGSIRPDLAGLQIGDQFYDANLGIPIWVGLRNGVLVWTNAAGAPV